MSGSRKPPDNPVVKPGESDAELLNAAAKVKRVTIFTRGQAPKDISAPPNGDKTPPGKKPGGGA